MPDTITYLLLAAATATAVTIYIFDPLAKPTTHSQPKFTQMNKPGDEPYMTPYNSSVYKNLQNDQFKASATNGPFVTGKTFIGW